MMISSDLPAREGLVRQGIAILLLGLPLVGAQLAQLAINTTGVMIVGRLGAVDLAGIVLSIQIQQGARFNGSMLPYDPGCGRPRWWTLQTPGQIILAG